MSILPFVVTPSMIKEWTFFRWYNGPRKKLDDRIMALYKADKEEEDGGYGNYVGGPDNEFQLDLSYEEPDECESPTYWFPGGCYEGCPCNRFRDDADAG